MLYRLAGERFAFISPPCDRGDRVAEFLVTIRVDCDARYTEEYLPVSLAVLFIEEPSFHLKGSLVHIVYYIYIFI